MLGHNTSLLLYNGSKVTLMYYFVFCLPHMLLSWLVISFLWFLLRNYNQLTLRGLNKLGVVSNAFIKFIWVGSHSPHIDFLLYPNNILYDLFFDSIIIILLWKLLIWLWFIMKLTIPNYLLRLQKFIICIDLFSINHHCWSNCRWQFYNRGHHYRWHCHNHYTIRHRRSWSKHHSADFEPLPQ